MDQFLPRLKPIYDDYLKQKAAKPKYEQVLDEQSPRLDALKAAERPSQPMTAKAGEADAALGQARDKAQAKDFVGACDQMKAVHAAVDALDKLAKDPQRTKFWRTARRPRRRSTPRLTRASSPSKPTGPPLPSCGTSRTRRRTPATTPARTRCWQT